MVWFISVALLSSGGLVWLLYDASSRALEQTYRAQLMEVGLRKSSALENYASEALRNVSALGHAAGTVAAVRELAEISARAGAISAAYQEALVTAALWPSFRVCMTTHKLRWCLSTARCC